MEKFLNLETIEILLGCDLGRKYLALLVCHAILSGPLCGSDRVNEIEDELDEIFPRIKELLNNEKYNTDRNNKYND